MNIAHSGYIAIVGRPNVGKSTLLNRILGEKLAAVSPKPQTTRNRITGIYTEEDTQIIFLDTPGMHRPRNKLGEFMVRTVRESIADVDAAVLVIEPAAEPQAAELSLVERLREEQIPAILAINKIDQLKDKSGLIWVMESWSRQLDFKAVVPVSAADGEGVDELLAEMKKLIPEGPQYYPEDQLTTEPERAVVGEIIREKMLRLLSEEIPHGVAVSVEKFHERDAGDIIDIEANIYCEKESHKGMIIGKGGAMLKKIGTVSRGDIEQLLGCHVNLKLWVKVKEDWRNREQLLKTFGYD